jgi:phosphotransferase system HPr (HPr) family protein
MSGPIATRKVTVSHAAGLHARPCLAIVNTARRFNSKVKLRNGRQEADAGQILELLSMGVAQGTEVTLTAVGPDADAALDALTKLFAENFGFDD